MRVREEKELTEERESENERERERGEGERICGNKATLAAAAADLCRPTGSRYLR